MDYLYILGSYCFTYGDFEDLIKRHTYRSDIAQWLHPLLEDGILFDWLSSLNHAKADSLVRLISDCRSAAKSTDSIIKRLCLEIELA